MSWLEFVSAIVQAMVWPIALVVVVWRISPFLPSLIPRIHKLGPSGVELFPQSEVRPPSEISGGENSLSADLEPLQDTVAAQLEEANRKDLERFPDERKVPLLLRALTNQQMQKSFAVAYSGIFGSQIRALRELNSRPISEPEANRMFSDLQAEIPGLENWNLEIYLSYLQRWQFITKSEEMYRITETGRNFLQFLVASGLSENRPN